MKDSLLGKNKYLRQAIASAFSREEWIDTFTNGRGIKMIHALPPGIPGRDSKATLKFDHDLSRAKDLLKKAGYPNGEGLPVLKFDLRGADSSSRQMGEFFQSQFAKAGIRVECIYNTFPAFLGKLKTSDLQIFLGGWQMDYPDSENIYQLLYGPNSAPGPNEVNFNLPEYNRVFEKMAYMKDGAQRSALIRQLEDLIQEEVPWAYGFYTTHYSLTAPWLQNYRLNDLIPNKFKYMRINRDQKREGKKKR
jgi:ABC-type transport system substrate-binding protein